MEPDAKLGPRSIDTGSFIDETIDIIGERETTRSGKGMLSGFGPFIKHEPVSSGATLLITPPHHHRITTGPSHHPAPTYQTKKTVADELVAVHWTPQCDSCDPPGSQLLTPPELLRLVRDTIIPTNAAKVHAEGMPGRKLVFVARTAQESRSVLNQEDLVSALHQVRPAHCHGVPAKSCAWATE
mmetsp:Transcript_63512/g.175095  ORF Transcript_63512/g.175095 Transcript_63512/m.175095 type:complete len:184 (+) Transcript_63512:745-1296(+)